MTKQGFDIEKNATVLKSGEQIGSPEIGLLATVGVTMVKVFMIIWLSHKSTWING